DGLRDPDREAFLAIGAAMVALSAPLVIAAAGVVYLAGRVVRIRWWWPVATGTAAGLAAAVVYGPAGLAGRYGAGYRHLWLEAHLSAHAFVAGASRSGKTTALVAVARAVVAGWGRPLIYIDLKGDPDVTDRLRRVAEAAGTPFWGWSLEGGATWNPLAHGDA